MKTYQKLANTLEARNNCIASDNAEWQSRHEQTMTDLVKETAPSGSGIDCGTKFDVDKSTPEKLVFNVDYHHMDNGGYYDGWTQHIVFVRPSLAHGFNLYITGKDRNQIKEYLHEVYSTWLNQDVPNQSSQVS